MISKAWDLWAYTGGIHDEYKYLWYSNNQKKEYASEIYFRIFSMVKHCLTIIEHDDDFHVTAPTILRSLIEAAVELENLRYVNGYEKYLELISRKEEYQFVKNYNESFMDYISDERDYSTEYESDSEKEKYRNLKEDVYSSLNVSRDVNIFTVRFKFSLLNKEENEKRHTKYEMLYDLLCAHSHHNLHFISKHGLQEVADIKKFKLFYLDLIGSILKNGLINLFNIFDIHMKKKEFKRLKQLKRDIMESNKTVNLRDILRNWRIWDEFESNEY
ncbi:MULTISPECIES: DUF5677 domain-containing protein [Lysinibacillus]|uniref:DUF5677 domain-containing protein n=1 Tax=Lysinibacillus TaxID=400634 RepID=UPI002599A788|nr:MULTISPECIES: DUF5677 domain-containing protein [Lysinibacillus]